LRELAGPALRDDFPAAGVAAPTGRFRVAPAVDALRVVGFFVAALRAVELRPAPAVAEDFFAVAGRAAVPGFAAAVDALRVVGFFVAALRAVELRPAPTVAEDFFPVA